MRKVAILLAGLAVSLQGVGTAQACKPCGDPAMPLLVQKAHVIAVARVTAVTAADRPPPNEKHLDTPRRQFLWQVKVEDALKGNPPAELTVRSTDEPPCITARGPTPGRYVMLLYRGARYYSPLTYCDPPLFAIGPGDQVALGADLVRQVGAKGDAVALTTLKAWIAGQVATKQ
ncbi:MAG: hypothetical protein HY902_20210 [Deltaproteobacteria bacterium]|nr:hypothetical protein [Deltaproteobacteria bacterium]